MTAKSSFTISLCSFIVACSLLTANAQTGSKKQGLPEIELKLHNNETVKLTELKGKVVLLDFWYRGCYPCLKAIPVLIELQEEFKDDLIIIGINTYDIQEDVIDYIVYKKMNYSSTFKNGDKLAKMFNVKEYPTTMLYDRNGNLVKIDSGFSEASMKSLRRAIQKALK